MIGASKPMRTSANDDRVEDRRLLHQMIVIVGRPVDALPGILPSSDGPRVPMRPLNVMPAFRIAGNRVAYIQIEHHQGPGDQRDNGPEKRT